MKDTLGNTVKSCRVVICCKSLYMAAGGTSTRRCWSAVDRLPWFQGQAEVLLIVFTSHFWKQSMIALSNNTHPSCSYWKLSKQVEQLSEKIKERETWSFEWSMRRAKNRTPEHQIIKCLNRFCHPSAGVGDKELEVHHKGHEHNRDIGTLTFAVT